MKMAAAVIGALIAISVSFLAGRYYEQIQSRAFEAEWSAERDALLVRTESYVPSCEDIASRHAVVRNGADTFVIEVVNDRLVVFGLNAGSNTTPSAVWWGAALEPVRSKCNLRGTTNRAPIMKDG